MQIQKLVSRLAIFALVALAATPAMAQIGARTFSPYELERLGLEKVWSGQLPIDPHKSDLESFRQVLSMKDPMVVFEVKQNGKAVTFSSNELDVIGKPLGEEGAKKKVDQYVARLDSSKGEPEVTRREVPNATFLVQSSSGILMAVDGRTGKTDWAELRGNPRFPQTMPDANDDIVVSVSGFTLSCLRRDNGTVMWTRDLEGLPIAGPVVGDDFIYVPLLDGTVVAYNFDGGPRLVPRYKSIGRIRMPMLATTSSIAWATDRNYFYVGYADRPLVRYRIESSGEIIAPPSNAGALRLFFTTTTGYVYCVYSTDGSIQWRFSCGEPIDSSAVAIGDSVYVTLQRGGMYKLGLEEGDVRWFMPRIKKFLSAGDKYVYCLDENSDLVVLDINSGARVGSMGLQGYDFFHTNAQTDRIIFGTKSGKMVVLRSSSLPDPLLYVKVTKPGEKPEPPEGKPKQEEAAPAGAAGGNPFAPPAAGSGGGTADPFGPPATGGGNTADPFGSGGSDGGSSSDPFGGGSSDPFGGGASDPFGSGDDSGSGMENPFGN